MALEIIGKKTVTNPTNNELSEVANILKEHNTTFVVVGVREAESSFKSFVDGKYLDGEVYTAHRRLYREIGLKRYSLKEIGWYMCTMFCRKASLSKMVNIMRKNISGDLRGDGLRLGGTFVVKDGHLAYSHVMEAPDDHPDVATILKALEIQTATSQKTITQQPKVICDEDVCKPIY
ncbi:DgyrCDS12822 [Dimorphilus gyrociliatus]|uniref:DgyrCDS12822 n=1 Tax=Dimorphilus gyrociliatus TaxID=2664684 RepID=A0A7I8W8T8_9ANNE|nr:DgyrCDS12822 [Dimorphilus gyrociliatus]